MSPRGLGGGDGGEWELGVSGKICPGLCGERVGFRFLPDNTVPYQPVSYSTGMGWQVL